jgi:hypothetical protein
MNAFQLQMVDRLGRRARSAANDKNELAAHALRVVHATAESNGAIELRDLERIMVAFGATRELRHP